MSEEVQNTVNVEAPQSEPQQSAPTQTVIINQPAAKKSNGIGTAGFVLALCGLVFCWVPILNLILWLLGAILSTIGVFKKPKGLSIAGLVISFILIIVIIVFFGALLAASSGL